MRDTEEQDHKIQRADECTAGQQPYSAHWPEVALVGSLPIGWGGMVSDAVNISMEK